MRRTIVLFLLCLLVSKWSVAQLDSVLVCDVKFKTSKFDNGHAGSGFLVKYDKKVYACTAKHVLFFAKTENMKTISFGNDLKSWSFISKKNPDIKLLAGKLINENKEEPLAMPPNGDWLVFETMGEIPDGLHLFDLRTNSLEIGERLYFMGYPYGSNVPIKVEGRFKGYTETGNLSLDVPKGTYNGCSGGPVFDRQGLLVGLVSMGYIDQTTDSMVFEPASVEYFKKTIVKITIHENQTES
ncbi:MAG: trypsin-like peptidase domain-containing protein [Algicola sp.]|nr:trypsin-like peptidase domain-containing protein [Algicola sp.]